VALTMQRIPVTEASQVGSVRRAAADLALGLGFDETETARVALVATEMASNLAKHGREGEMLLQAAAPTSDTTIELIALDRGPGIADVARALQDGVSSSGTPGTGLGAIRRVATRFDLYSTAAGTALLAVLALPRAAATAGFEVGSVTVPYPGESICGDAVAVAQSDGRAVVMVVDGLGHGTLAFEAAERACEVFAASHTLPPVELMRRLHGGLRPTRGAGAVAEVDARRGVVRYCGVGNIAATILVDGATRSLVSHHGTIGHDARKIAEFQYPWTAESTLVMNSDGLVSNWTLAGYPGLVDRAPSLIAAVLYRDCRRQRDDASVLVLRGKS
jgi:anti-sigma regulatory factor (Ser/Thr protein kinase)